MEQYHESTVGLYTVYDKSADITGPVFESQTDNAANAQFHHIVENTFCDLSLLKIALITRKSGKPIEISQNFNPLTICESSIIRKNNSIDFNEVHKNGKNL